MKYGLLLKTPVPKKLNVSLEKTLDNGVVEIVFKRRLWPLKGIHSFFNFRNTKIKKKPERRMLCTSNWDFLLEQQKNFKFKIPLGVGNRDKKWYKDKNLKIVWDLILLDWRMINLDEYHIVNYIILNSDEKKQEFLNDYKNTLKKFGRKKLIKRLSK